jgi:putative transposase
MAYYCQCGVQTQRRIEHTPTSHAVGSDLGVTASYADSDGNTVENPRQYRQAQKRLKRLHRRLSKKQKGSANRKQVAKAYLKVSGQCEDVARKTANALVSSSDFLAYEDLQIRNMVRNHHLSTSISDVTWGTRLL